MADSLIYGLGTIVFFSIALLSIRKLYRWLRDPISWPGWKEFGVYVFGAVVFFLGGVGLVFEVVDEQRRLQDLESKSQQYKDHSLQ